MKTETVDEMVGFLAAANERLPSLRPPRQDPPGGHPDLQRRPPQRQPDAAAGAAAAALRRAGAGARPQRRLRTVTSEQIFAEFGLLPCGSLRRRNWRSTNTAWPTCRCRCSLPASTDNSPCAAVSGLRNSAHSLVKMLDPFHGEALLLAAATHPDYLTSMRAVLTAAGATRSCCAAAKANPSPIPSAAR
jgi:hypothetical protein